MADISPESERVRLIYERISEAAATWPPTTLSHYDGQPFKALVAAMLSAQTREEHTLQAMNNLFTLATDPADILALSDEQILRAISPVTYYHNKARYLRGICQRLLEVDGGVVPRTLEGLTAYPGVGWKVAVLTLEVAFHIHDDITVDVHVARISKRLGLVKLEVKQPPRINEALKVVLPREYWPFWNGLMVQFGRAVCKPTYPQCASCFVRDLCPRVGVIQTGPRSFKDAELG